jgi:hypothetical protein
MRRSQVRGEALYASEGNQGWVGAVALSAAGVPTSGLVSS